MVGLVGIAMMVEQKDEDYTCNPSWCQNTGVACCKQGIMG